MMHSLMNHCFPTFIFAFYLIIFLLLSKVVFHFKYKLSKNTQETAMGIVGTIGAFYSIFLGFVVYILWSNYQKTYEFVNTEASELYIISQSSRAFPPEIQHNIMKNLTQYIASILNDDLVAMSLGEEEQITEDVGDKLYRVLLQYKPKASVSIFYHNAVSSLNQAIQYRNFRLNMLKPAIPIAWYIIIFLGAFFIIGIYSLESSLQGHPFLYILCIFLGIYMTAITVLSFPFSGWVKVSDIPFHRVYKALNNVPVQSSGVEGRSKNTNF
ncbi:Uncharacterised protein [Legionella steigerwaltii]|uniref:DUF4239 domain-containing protein n=1 Tax=Legionella steigerwaltii TaxID=460 RepID=A0A378L6U1_9GAMM|nr:DUF4239 domain-containing protein [Legionella steigerwaltii]KTD77354.1 hypothetical protein Lstg_1711 [Legionella steigerwaltii]STY22080.1 Uncharacterised protein [Legionella steigerwaltii]